MVASITTPTARRTGQVRYTTTGHGQTATMGITPETARGLAQKFEANRKQAAKLYEQFTKDLPAEPEVVIVDKSGKIYLTVKDTAEITDRSRVRVQAWGAERKVDVVKPGLELFIASASALIYVADVAEGKRRGGRKPRKTAPETTR